MQFLDQADLRGQGQEDMEGDTLGQSLAGRGQRGQAASDNGGLAPGTAFRVRIPVFRRTCGQSSRCSLRGKVALGREAPRGPSRTNKMGSGRKTQALASSPGAEQLL